MTIGESTPGRRMQSVMTPLELAAGTIFGLRDDVPPLPTAAAGSTPRQAIEAVLHRSLQRAPCVVSFSGGRDSSAVLALAAHVARRDGLPLPIPVTLRFPDCESAQETQWQEMVVRHLALPHWQREEFHDELDLIGPVSAPLLRKHGLLWPFNAFFHLPILRAAAGGTVLTGVGGDELFGRGWTWQRENAVASRQSRPLPLDVVRLPISVGPRPVRRAFLRKRQQVRSHPTPWLTPPAQRAILDQHLEAAAEETLSWRTSVRRIWWPRRSRFVGDAALNLLAEPFDAQCISPLCDPEFIAAVIDGRGWRMLDSRTSAMQDLVGDLLPTELIARPTKASFDDAFFNIHSRAFAREWTGAGVDAGLVDITALQHMWTDPQRPPDARTYSLLQAAWLADSG